MFVRNIEGLEGFLGGYALGQDNFQNELWGFIEFLAELKGEKPNISTWTKLISQEAEKEAYEIPIFFDYLDRYRGFDYQILGEVELTWAQRAFALERQLRIMNVDYIECPLKPPHTLRAIVLPNGDLHVFGYDKKGKKYDEYPRMKDFSYVKTWAKTCFGINETAWHKKH